MSAISSLSVGEPAPWFSATTVNDRGKSSVAFDELAGRYTVLFFFGTATLSSLADVLTTFEDRNDLFADKRALFLGILEDQNDFDQARMRPKNTSQNYFLDINGAVAKQYGVTEPTAFILTPALQIIEIVPLTDPAAFVGRITSHLSELLAKPPSVHNAPVLVVPQVFDSAFCGRLIDLFEAAGGREIGAIEAGGKVVQQFDPTFRKRLDWYISDDAALQSTRALLERRLLPMIHRAFQFETTRIERYLVGCYDASTGGYFQAHRDNTAPVVAHRRFAVTINLNEDYDGGYLCFPEYGDSYSTAPGEATVFSCSLLHEVTPVTRGRRYAFVSFFYDERGQQLRDEIIKKSRGEHGGPSPGK